MGPKKGDKNKKKPKKSTRLTKTQYNTLVSENNEVLAQQKKKTEIAEDNFFKTEKRYGQVQEDLDDVIKFLQHGIQENESESAAFSMKIDKLNKEIRDIDRNYEAIFNKMDGVYEEKKVELQHQIQQINAKLFASEEVRQQREEYLRKKEEFNAKLEEMEVRHEKEIYMADKTATIKQDTMQKDMEAHLTSLIVDFRQASDFAIGETINKLVRDNITLGHILTCIQGTIEKAREAFRKAFKMEVFYKYNAELVEKEHSTILKRYDERMRNIEAIIKSQEDLYERIASCQKLIKGNRRLQRQIAEEECILREKNEEVKHLLRNLSERENLLANVEDLHKVARREVASLEITVFEAAKRIKEAIEIENLTRLEDETGAEDKEDQEENLIEFKFKHREMAIDEAVNILANELTGESDAHLNALSSELYVKSFQSFSNV